MPLDPSIDKVRVRGRAQNSLGAAGLPPSFFPTVPRLVNKASHARIEMLPVGPYDNQTDGAATATAYWNPTTGDWWADLIAVDDPDVLAAGQSQWGQWLVDDRGQRYYIEPKLVSPTFYGNATTGAPLAQGSGGIRTVWLDDLVQLAPAASLPGVPTNSSGGLDVETVQDSIAGMFTGGTNTGVAFSYRDDVGLVDTTVTVTGDLPESSAGVYSSAAGTPTDLLGKINEYTGIISQPMPPALPGRVLAFRQRTVGLTLNRAGTDVFVLGDGSQVTSVSPSIAGELVQYHCTVTGQWRAVSDFKPTSGLDKRFAPNRRDFHIDSFGADPTGVADSTAAWNAALAAMPTATVYADPDNTSSTSAVHPVGTLRLGSGTYRLGGSGNTNNIGPFVNVLGSGTNATVLDYRGSRDCIRMFNAVKPTSDTFDDLSAFAGRIDGLTITGKNSQVGAVGIRYGDTEGGTIGPDILVRDFDKWLTGPPTISLGAASGTGGTTGFDGTPRYWRVTALTGAGGGQETPTGNEVNATIASGGTQTLNWTAVAGATGYRIYVAKAGLNYGLAGEVAAGTLSYTDTGDAEFRTTTRWDRWRSTAGSAGVVFDNQVSWTENMKVWLSTYNCSSGIIFSGFGGTDADASFMYNTMNLKIYAMPTQHGVVMTHGAFYVNGQLTIRGNMAKRNTSAMLNSLLLVQGAGLTKGGATRLSPGTPSVIKDTELSMHAELNLPGAFGPSTIWQETPWQNVIYNCFGQMRFSNAPWAVSNRTPATDGQYAFVYHGAISGDASLVPGETVGTTAAFRFGPLYPQAGGKFVTASGDISTPYTLTGNTTITFGTDNPGFPQRKTIVLKQAVAGGFTVTWPKGGTPSLTTPTVLWSGGTAPVMTGAGGAVDVYHLSTADGITWYGSATQNVS